MRGAPFTKNKDGKVRDRGGEVIDLFPGVREILLEVHRGHRFRDTKLAIASRTSHDRWGGFCDWCRRALGELRWLQPKMWTCETEKCIWMDGERLPDLLALSRPFPAAVGNLQMCRNAPGLGAELLFFSVG